MKSISLTFFKKNARIIGLFIGIAMLAAGAGLIVPSAYYQHQSTEGTSLPIELKAPLLPQIPDVLSGTPVRLQIPSVSIDLEVAPGTYNEATRTWSISTTAAHYATMSVKPNNITGNTFIYGHYRPSVFYRLPKAALGAEAIITTDNGLAFHYTLSNVSETNPQDVSIFNASSSKPTLTLQTCSGTYFQNRQLFRFDFVSVEHLQ